MCSQKPENLLTGRFDSDGVVDAYFGSSLIVFNMRDWCSTASMSVFQTEGGGSSPLSRSKAQVETIHTCISPPDGKMY